MERTRGASSPAPYIIAAGSTAPLLLSNIKFATSASPAIAAAPAPYLAGTRRGVPGASRGLPLWVFFWGGNGGGGDGLGVYLFLLLFFLAL